MASNNCPKCQKELTILQSSGRLVCRSCGWSSSTESTNLNQKTGVEGIKNIVGNFINHVVEKDTQAINKSIDQTSVKKSPEGFGGLLFISGLIMMFYGLGMNTTVCSFSRFDCTHNIGRLNTRSNVVNVGGFLGVCGAILITRNK